MDAGGEDYGVIPCLNEDDRWIQYLVDQVDMWIQESN